MESEYKRFLFLSLFFYFLSLLSKEMAITMPFIIVLYEYTFHKQEIKKNFKLPIFFIITASIYFLIRFYVVEPIENEYPLSWRIATFSKVILYDIFILFFPFFHKVFYRVEILQSFFSFITIFFIMIFSAIFGVVLYLKKYDRRLFFSFMWIIVTVIPATTIVTFIYPSLIAERYLYIPSFGLAMFLGVLYNDFYEFICRKYPTKTSVIKMLFAGITFVFFLLTFQRNFEYKDNLSLWKSAEKDEPYEPYVIDKLATTYIEKKYYLQAEIELKRLEVADPNNPQVHHKLGNLYKRWGKYKLAEIEYNNALRLDPSYYLALNDLADLYKRLGDFDKSLFLFFKSLEINPNDSDVLYEIGEIYLNKNDLVNAESFFKNVLAYNPDYFKAYGMLGEIYVIEGKLALAKEMYEKALSLDEENEEYKNKLKKLTGQ